MKKKTFLYALAFIVFSGLLGSQATQAAWGDRDNNRGWHDEDWREHARKAHEWHNRHWHNGHVIYEQNEPYVTYAPPIVVPPPPLYDYEDEQQSGVNIVVPLNIH